MTDPVSTGSTTNGDLSRADIEEFWETWLDVNRRAEQSGDWRMMADWYAEDATYGWMYSHDEHFMAVGREQIRDWAIGIEMDGFDGWHYDYVCTMIDEQKSMVLGFWKQRSGILKDDADPSAGEFEILGIGGSWFGVERQTAGADAGQIKIAWQRDWFDMPSTTHTFMEILKADKASERLLQRMSVFGHEVPGHYHLADMPSTVWPPPVEAGDYVTQNPPAKSGPVVEVRGAPATSQPVVEVRGAPAKSQPVVEVRGAPAKSLETPEAQA